MTNYVPINPDVYALAFQGAQSAIVSFERSNTATTPSAYSTFSAIAQTWAQSFDTNWNSNTKVDEVQAMGIHDSSFGFWAGSSNIALLSSLTVAQCTTYILPIIASIQSSEATFSAQAIVPPPWGGNSTATTVTSASFVQPAPGSNVAVSVAISNWMIIGQVVYIGFNGVYPAGGYYKVITISSTTSVILENLGYTGNAVVNATILSGSSVGPAGLQGNTGPAVSGLAPTEIVFGSGTGIIQQSTGLTWNETSQTLTVGGSGNQGLTTMTPGYLTPNPSSGTFTLAPANNASVGTNVNITAGATTISGNGGQINISGGQGGGPGAGGSIDLLGGAGGPGVNTIFGPIPTNSTAGGNISIKGGAGNSLSTGGTVTIQAGLATEIANNGAIKLIDGNGNTAFQVQNGFNLLDAPLLGDISTNNPLCFGVATVAYASTIVLTNAQYCCQTIRITGTATTGATMYVVFPDVFGGYTKVLDLTSLNGASNLAQVRVLVGSTSQQVPTKYVEILAPITQDIYTLSYDGFTLTCNQARVSTKIAGVIPSISYAQFQGNVNYNLVNETIQVGPSGTIAAFLTSTIGFTIANTQMNIKFLLNGIPLTNSTQYLNYASYPAGSWYVPFNINYPFNSLVPGASATVTAQYFGTNAWSVSNLNLILLSP